MASIFPDQAMPRRTAGQREVVERQGGRRYVRGMDGSIALPEAKEQLSDLLARVEKGEHITITQDGRPVAKLVPAEPAPADRDEIARVIQRLRELRKGTTTGGIGWKALRDAGRKFDHQ